MRPPSRYSSILRFARPRLAYVVSQIVIIALTLPIVERMRLPDDSRMRRPDPERSLRSLDPAGREAWQPPREVRGGDRLGAPSGLDPVFQVAVPAEQRNSIGTAFSLDDRGLWMTARHVVDGCARVLIAIATEPRLFARVDRSYIHRRADLAILQTRGSGPAVSFTRQKLRRGQTGYHFGFPKGKPVAVQSVLIGRRLMRSVGRYNVLEPVVVWADRVRVPEIYGGLGGISGGPAMDPRGVIVGVTVASSKRRGRIITTALTSIAAALDRADVAVDQGDGQPDAITASNFTFVGHALRSQLTVALVYCAVEG